MFGRGEYEFLGYLVQKSEDILLIFVPDNIPDVENTEEDDGVSISRQICQGSKSKTNMIKRGWNQA